MVCCRVVEKSRSDPDHSWYRLAQGRIDRDSWTIRLQQTIELVGILGSTRDQNVGSPSSCGRCVADSDDVSVLYNKRMLRTRTTG